MDSHADSDHLKIDDVGGVTIIRILDRVLDSQTAITGLQQELLQVVVKEDIHNVLLDLAAVELVTSLVLGKMIQVKDQISSKGGKLVLCNLHPRVLKVFAITKLAKLFDIKGDEAEGLASF